MKSKIFKPALLAMFALMALCKPTHAQDVPVPPQPPVEADLPRLYEMPKMDKETQHKMADIQSKMDVLQKQMSTLMKSQMTLSSKQMVLAMKDFKRFDKLTPHGQFDHIAPVIPELPALPEFKGMGHFGYSDEEWKKKIQDGEIKELSKNYNKSYTVDASDKLMIDNRYGKVTVNTWNKNEFKVDVLIKAAANEEAEAKRILNDISITDNKEGSLVSFKTVINSSNNTWGIWNNGGKSFVRKMEVNYVVYMPTKNALEITNRYGSTELPDFQGKVTINASYGSFAAKSLTNADNDIHVKYGSASIENLTSSDLNVAYGSLRLGSADKLNATISYGSAKIGKIRVSGNITAKYSGNLDIADVDKTMKSLSVNSSFSSVRLGLSGDENADFDVTVHNGNFSYGDHTVSITSQTPPDNERGWSPTKNYKGRLGKGNAERVININTKYGNVKFE